MAVIRHVQHAFYSSMYLSDYCELQLHSFLRATYCIMLQKYFGSMPSVCVCTCLSHLLTIANRCDFKSCIKSIV